MKTPQTVEQIKVVSCDEFDCPFHHCGHMGGSYCQIVHKDIKPKEMTEITFVFNWKTDSSEKKTVRVPKWCPLRKIDVVVHMEDV